MATYNREQFILEALHSIQNQNYINWECIIVNDGGKDKTEEIIQPLLKEDSRFSLYNRTNDYQKGLPGSRNYGIDLAKGDYIIFFDDDDFVHPDNLSFCLKAIKDNDVDFCHYQKQAFEERVPQLNNDVLMINGTLSKKDLDSIVTQQCAIASCTVLWSKKCFETVRFNENLHYAEEWECYSRIISKDFKGIILKNILYYNRKHPNSNTSEFWNNDFLRISSKKEAACLIAQNLIDKKILSKKMFKYLIGIPIGFRDMHYLRKILLISNARPKQLINSYLKYYLYPLWVFYKKL